MIENTYACNILHRERKIISLCIHVKILPCDFFLKILLSLISEISIFAEKVGFPRSGHI